jgi:fluoride ion exporter CrcB/FEX
VISSNNGIAIMIRYITSVSLSKKHYKKLSIAKFVLNYLSCLLIVYYYVPNSIH